jgi:hypothetical protein
MSSVFWGLLVGGAGAWRAGARLKAMKWGASLTAPKQAAAQEALNPKPKQAAAHRRVDLQEEGDEADGLQRVAAVLVKVVGAVDAGGVGSRKGVGVVNGAEP